MSFSKMFISNVRCGELVSCGEQVSCGSSSNFSESDIETDTEPPKSKMDYLMLALWICDPNDIDPPSWIIIPKPPKQIINPSKKNRRKTSSAGAAILQSRMQVELDHSYSAPLPAPKLCCGCNKNCRYKRLLQCNYCPFAYHQGCMNPSPDTMPNGSLWMCPNHPQYLIDCVASLPAFAAQEQSAQALPVHTKTVNEDVNIGTIVMDVGTADGCTLRLDAVQCRRVSSNHAAIYINEASEFKLINYSEYGTGVVVNGVVHGLDVAQARSPTVASEVRTTAPPVVQTVPLSSEHPCRCRSRRLPELTHGASMLIPPGCLLQFGCQIYLFCITPV